MTPNRLPDIVGVLVALLVATAIIGSFFDYENRKLDVVASAELIKGTVHEDGSVTEDSWQIDGRVLYDGTPINGADVWAIVSNTQGDEVAPDVATTAGGGRFVIADIPLRLGSSRRNETSDATVFAKVKVKLGEELIEERGEQPVKLSSVGQIRWIEVPFSTLLSLTLIFVTSIVIAVVQLPPGTFRLKLKYFGSVFLAFLFTFTIIGYISLGLQSVNASASPGEVQTLGFANIYYGSYVTDIEPEWVLSLTTPDLGSVDAIGELEMLTRGFGAPLWTLLLAVIGAGAFTIFIIVRDIKTPLDFNNIEAVRGRIQQAVKHQFYILFAPIAAIIVYQVLVLAGAASQYVTVGLATLGAGVGLSTILDKILRSLHGLFIDSPATGDN